MRKFGENLARYRKRAGFTQEGLAEALEVSRQAVGKWEAGTAYPSAEKLPVIADLLSCSLDALLRGEGPADEGEASEKESEREYSSGCGEKWVEVFLASQEGKEAFLAYDAHKNQFALKIATGVAIILSGISALLLIEARFEALGTCAFLIMVAIAVVMFITAGMSETALWQDYPAVPDLYSKEQKRRFRNIFGVGIAGSVAVIIVDAALLTATEAIWSGSEAMEAQAVAYFMFVMAGAVAALIYLGIQYSKYNMDGKKQIITPEEDAYDRRLEEAICRKLESEMNRAIEEMEAGRSDWSGTIMLGATIVFFLTGFLLNLWHISWLAFVAGGMLCLVVSNLQKKQQ